MFYLLGCVPDLMTADVDGMLFLQGTNISLPPAWSGSVITKSHVVEHGDQGSCTQ
jgi:hypothetical protein